MKNETWQIPEVAVGQIKTKSSFRQKLYFVRVLKNWPVCNLINHLTYKSLIKEHFLPEGVLQSNSYLILHFWQLAWNTGIFMKYKILNRCVSNEKFVSSSEWKYSILQILNDAKSQAFKVDEYQFVQLVRSNFKIT